MPASPTTDRSQAANPQRRGPACRESMPARKRHSSGLTRPSSPGAAALWVVTMSHATSTCALQPADSDGAAVAFCLVARVGAAAACRLSCLVRLAGMLQPPWQSADCQASPSSLWVGMQHLLRSRRMHIGFQKPERVASHKATAEAGPAGRHLQISCIDRCCSKTGGEAISSDPSHSACKTRTETPQLVLGLQSWRLQ